MRYFAFVFLAVVFCAVSAPGQTDAANKPYYTEDKIEAEIVEATKAIALEPNNPQLYLKRANLYRLKWNAQAVSSDVTKALGISPNDISIQFTAVRLLYELPGRAEEALAIINTTIADNPKNDEAFAFRSRVRNALGDYTGALMDIERAIELNPRVDIYKSNRAFLLQKLSQTDDALETFNQSISSLEKRLKAATDKQEIEKLKRELMSTFFERARLFAKNENFEAMFADLNSAVQIHPIYFAFQTRGRAYRWQKMYDEAVADFTKAVELNPKDAGSLFDRAETYFHLRKFPEAIADYEQILTLNRGFEKLSENRIAEAKQKMRENVSQPKP